MECSESQPLNNKLATNCDPRSFVEGATSVAEVWDAREELRVKYKLVFPKRSRKEPQTDFLKPQSLKCSQPNVEGQPSPQANRVEGQI